MHFLSVICRMFQEQKKAKEKADDKTKDGKKSKAEPEAWFLGMSVKNGMTVIERWSAIQRKHVMIS